MLVCNTQKTVLVNFGLCFDVGPSLPPDLGCWNVHLARGVKCALVCDTWMCKQTRFHGLTNLRTFCTVADSNHETNVRCELTEHLAHCMRKVPGLQPTRGSPTSPGPSKTTLDIRVGAPNPPWTSSWLQYLASRKTAPAKTVLLSKSHRLLIIDARPCYAPGKNKVCDRVTELAKCKLSRPCNICKPIYTLNVVYTVDETSTIVSDKEASVSHSNGVYPTY